MSNSAASLPESASAIYALGVCRGDIDALDDASLTEGMRLVSAHELELQKYKLWLAAAIYKRSHHELGYDGLARRSGSATPAIFIQKLTGSSLGEATKLVRLGSELVNEEVAPTGIASVTSAATSGSITLDAADAIRKGLGTPDAAVDAEQLSKVAASLIEDAPHLTPEALLKAARLRRAEIDSASVERGEMGRSDARYARLWQRDGMSGGSWCLPDEDGGLEVHTAMKLLLARKTDGPRFVETKTSAGADDDTATANVTDTDTANAPEDTRSMDQILADGFATIFHNGLNVDPTVVPGSGRAAIRVIVTQQKLNMMFVGGLRCEDSADGGIQNLALLEDTTQPISDIKLAEYLCAVGRVAVEFDSGEQIINIGREQRLFTTRQRVGLALRDGGCRFPGCTKPPSWTEAHHIEEWQKDHGTTDICNGILLCRYHHMLMHQPGWAIIRNGADYWVKPPVAIDPQQRLIPMPSKNPILRAMDDARAGAGASTSSATG